MWYLDPPSLAFILEGLHAFSQTTLPCEFLFPSQPCLVRHRVLVAVASSYWQTSEETTEGFVWMRKKKPSAQLSSIRESHTSHDSCTMLSSVSIQRIWPCNVLLDTIWTACLVVREVPYSCVWERCFRCWWVSWRRARMFVFSYVSVVSARNHTPQPDSGLRSQPYL